MSKNRSLGFTLIELLVVVAIIGILSAVVLASLGTARSKAKDASAQTSMAQGRAGAEIAYATNNSYTNLCPTITTGDPTAVGSATDSSAFYEALNNARSALTTAATADNTVTGFVTCSASATAYAASIKLSTNSYCIDSTGFAGSRTTPGLSAQACPAS